MADALLYLTERDVVSVLDMRRAIDALHGMLVAQGRDEARNLPKALATWGDGSSMHALGSVQTGEGGYAGFKTWVHTKAGGGSVFSLFDARTGFLRAVIEARALGMLRTAAISGVATRPGAAGRQPRALIGTGPQAVTQLAALAEVRELRRCACTAPRRKSAAPSSRRPRPAMPSRSRNPHAGARAGRCRDRDPDHARRRTLRGRGPAGRLPPPERGGRDPAGQGRVRAGRVRTRRPWWSTTWRTPGAVRASCASATASMHRPGRACRG